ncbi:hypothetical protein Tco_0565425 [Tanacetum coccineum]
MNELSKQYSRLENYCISLELKLQQNNESFQNNRACSNLDAPALNEFFVINDLKAQLQAKESSISKLRAHIATLKGKNVSDNNESVNNASVIAPRMFRQPLLSSTGVIASTSASGSQSKNNTRKNRIMPTASSNKKNKTVEVHPRKVVQIVLWYLDLGCSKYMTGNRSQLINFVENFIGTVIFGNDHTAKIMGYGDYQIGNVMISRVYYVEGLGHNLFSVGQFCDSDLEVAFWKHTCFVRNLEGIDLLIGSRDTNQLSHLNFATINELAKQGLVRGLPKLKYKKDHLCSACSLGKSKKYTHKPKAEYTIQEKLYLLNMDLYGPMRVESINGKKYILVEFFEGWKPLSPLQLAIEEVMLE